jgi:colicin import membrane protein
MQITSKQTLLFRVQGQMDFILRPSQRPVNAPEYIRDTNLFKLAVSDKTVEEFVPAAPVDEAKVAADKAAAEAKAKADADAKDAADKAAAAKAEADKQSDKAPKGK